MRFKPYPAYKPSGVEWLGDVPEHWIVKSIKWVTPVQRGASPRPIDDTKYFDDEGEYAWVRIADVSASDGMLRETTQRLSELGSSLSVKIFPNELFVSIAGTVGKPCISKIKACIHDGFVYFPALKIPPMFLFRIFEAGTCYGGLGKFGTQLNLNTDTIGSIRITFPPSKEIDGILSFLDRETAKIDTLIARQERLIELLKEKRQTVISHAVTKGLNPHVKMKNSGIEWLGDVPEHWNLKQLKYLVQVVDSGVSVNASDMPANQDESGVLKTSCVYGDIFRPDENKTVWEVEKVRLSCPVKKNTLIVSRMNTPALVGSCGYVESDFPSLYLPDRLWMISFHKNIAAYITKFIWYGLTSDSVKAILPVLATGTSDTMKNISQGDFMSIALPIPPIQECLAIVEYLDLTNKKFDTLIAKAQQAIILQKEHRTALISAAVTGKIDVREAI